MTKLKANTFEFKAQVLLACVQSKAGLPAGLYLQSRLLLDTSVTVDSEIQRDPFDKPLHTDGARRKQHCMGRQ